MQEPHRDEAELRAADAVEAFRGRLFTDLDRLAFALELEAAGALAAGDEPRAERTEHLRLGVRLAQRLVSGVHADEVDERLRAVGDAYDDRVHAPVA